MAYFYKLELDSGDVRSGPYSTIVKSRKALLFAYKTKYMRKEPSAGLELYHNNDYIGSVSYAPAIRRWVYLSEISGVASFLNVDGTLGKRLTNKDWNKIMG